MTLNTYYTGKRKYIYTAFLVFFIIANSLLITQVILYSRNTLKENGNWISIKPLMQIGLMGAQNYFVTRNALARNQLHLGAWFGYQMLFYKNEIAPKKLKFDFYIKDNEYFYILFHSGKNYYSGIRISTHRVFDSAVVEGSTPYDYRIINKIDLSKILFKNKKNIFGMVKNKNDHYSILINNITIATSIKIYPPFYFGYRSSLYDIIIDNIEIADQLSNKNILEYFYNYQNYFEIILFSLVTISFLNIAFNFLSKNKPNLFYRSITLNLTIFFLFIGYYSFDYFHWSSNYHIQLTTEKASWITQKFEKIRERIFFIFNDKYSMWPLNLAYTSPLINNHYASDPSQRFIYNPQEQILSIFSQKIQLSAGAAMEIQNFREKKNSNNNSALNMVLIGSSQAVGAGASSIHKSISVQLYNNLIKNDPLKKIHLINCSEPGLNSSDLWEKFIKNCVNLHIHVLVINLSNNDGNINEFRKSLGKFINFAKKNNSKIIFSLEANSVETSPWCSSIVERHTIMKILALQHDIPIFDAHGLLQKEELADSSFLWWDCVHLTDKGQDILAKKMSSFIKKQSQNFR